MKNLIRFGAILPVAATSLLAIANSANAAVIPFTNDQFNFSVGFQTVGIAESDGIPVGANDQLTGATKGFNNSFADLLWAPTKFTDSAGPLVASDRIINENLTGTPSYCAPIDSPLLDAQVGECGNGNVNGNLSGAFLGVRNLGVVTLRHIDDEYIFNTPFGFDEPWMQVFSNPIFDPTGVSRRFDFMLTSAFLTIQPSTLPSNLGNTIITNGPVDALLEGAGMVRQVDTTCSVAQINANTPGCVTYGNFDFSQTIQGFRDDGVASAGDPVAADFITNITSTSFSVIVTAKTPEPSSLVGLVAVAGLGLMGLRKKLSK